MSRNAPRPATLEFYQDKAGKHRWRLQSSNGNKIACSSQGYATIIDCKKNAELIGNLLGQYRAVMGTRDVQLTRSAS